MCARNRGWSPAESWRAPARSSHRRASVSTMARHRRADIAAHLHRHAGFAQDVADQAGGGGLAVRSGDADGAALQKRRRQFHFADHADAPRRAPLRAAAGRPAHRARARSGRSLRTLRAICGANGIRSRSSDSRASGSSSSGFRSVARTSAPCAHAGTPPTRCPTSSSRRPALCALQFHAHLSFNVVSANSASTRPAIQKRAMIFDSVQPSASK